MSVVFSVMYSMFLSLIWTLCFVCLWTDVICVINDGNDDDDDDDSYRFETFGPGRQHTVTVPLNFGPN